MPLSTNTGTTSLKTSPRRGDKMRSFDGLPPDLRRWVASAALPWRAASVKAAYGKALRQTGCPTAALRALDALQDRLIAKDAAAVWGANHPHANIKAHTKKPPRHPGATSQP
ncbi:DUF6525 family protein [Pseudaestuariivita sp.]|uniref:DUF6525 family protein n=1 Tax=Pseudaestuariivita sp. TaxID=2211669 RepID=UPI0040592742